MFRGQINLGSTKKEEKKEEVKTNLPEVKEIIIPKTKETTSPSPFANMVAAITNNENTKEEDKKTKEEDKKTKEEDKKTKSEEKSKQEEYEGVREKSKKAHSKLDEVGKEVEKISSGVVQLRRDLEPLQGNKNASVIFDNIEKSEESLKKASEKIAQGAPETEVKLDTDEATKYLEKAKSGAEKLLKEGDLSQSERKALEQFLKNLDKTLISLHKIGLSDRDTITQRQNDEIFERTLLKNFQNKRNIDQFSEETVMIGISNYYFAVREMAKEIEATNSEKISKKEKEEKIEEIFEKHYETLKTGNEDHDKTLNSFLIYNMTMEFGSKEQKENVSKEIKVKTEDGKETTLKDRCNKEVIELYNSCVSSPGFGWNEKEGCHKINQ